MPEAEHDPATLSPPSLHGAMWNGKQHPGAEMGPPQGQPPSTVPGQGPSQRDRWAQVAPEGHAPPPAEIGTPSVGPVMCSAAGWIFTRPLPLL